MGDDLPLAEPAKAPAPSAIESSVIEMPKPSAGDIVADRYRLLRVLGRGGMGLIWAASHQELKNEVAIKFLDRIPKDDPEAVVHVLERFRFEAQISARLGARTKHIVSAHDAGSHEGMPYLVMELVEGRTLEAEIESDGPLELERFGDILAQVGEALAEAHAMGILHRDLKPSNIMLTDRGEGRVFAKLADFGVAKAMRNLDLDRPKETLGGYLVGSPAYMSPEQLRAEGETDVRSDVWSLGVVAYEALTGSSPFVGSSLTEIIVGISTKPLEQASVRREDLPQSIDRWFEKALAKEATDRFESIEAMVRAYEDAVAPAPVFPARSRFVFMIAIACMAVVGLGATLLLRRSIAGAETENTATPPPVATAAPVTQEMTASPPSPPVTTLPTAVEAPVTPRISATPIAKRPTATGERPVAPPPPPPSVTATARAPKEVDKSEIQ